MVSRDFIDFEAGDTIGILKNESIMMEGMFELSTNFDGDFANCSNTSSHLPEDKVVQQMVKGIRSPKTTGTSTETKLGYRRVSLDGGVSYKNINTSKIMESLRIGLERSMSVLSEKPERDVLMVDFMTVESTNFTSGNSARVSRDGDVREFIFKTYAPVAFRHFRDLFGIGSSEFVSSFSDAPLVQLSNPGASGSVFYLTHNDNFITKTVQYKEAEFLQKLLPGYYLNLNQNPITLLPKFFGLYCYKCDSKNIRMVVMNNVLPSKLRIHSKYDLKGSTFNRKASAAECQKSSPTFKDLDFISHHPEGIFLGEDDYKTLVTTIQRDCRVLESFQIMDYSLLLGIHNVDQAKLDTDKENEQCYIQAYGDGNKQESTIEDCSSDIQSKKASKKYELDGDLLSDKCKTGNKTGHLFLSGLPATKANGERLLLFIGIIDILQSYGLRKRLEHAWKAVLHDSKSVSVHNPTFYSRRFQEFMAGKVFKTAPVSPKSKPKVYQDKNLSIWA